MAVESDKLCQDLIVELSEVVVSVDFSQLDYCTA